MRRRPPPGAGRAARQPLTAQITEDRLLVEQIAAQLKQCPADVQKIFI